MSILLRLLDLIAPRPCAVCGRRLAVSEQLICTSCLLHMPWTDHPRHPYDNDLAKRFWHLLPIERAVALWHYKAKANTTYPILQAKYFFRPEAAETLGLIAARWLQPTGFFEGIDVIIPIPIAKKRQRQRGYNQSERIARGVSAITGIPVNDQAVKRRSFKRSQTKLDRTSRRRNVEGQYELVDPVAVHGKHILLIDDVCTTGATIRSCGSVLVAAGDIKISVLVIGIAGEHR
ncbi:MAG: ComF family protein [Prevotellaceae bacterium]|nr:ComF family protein [Prevotellaceae bacterium]